jgi:IS1 family transposase
MAVVPGHLAATRLQIAQESPVAAHMSAESSSWMGAALRLIRKLLKIQWLVPTSIVTDRYRAYAAALRDLGLSVIHRQGNRLNYRAESSHIRIRRRERKMQGFRSAGSAQRSVPGTQRPTTPFFQVEGSTGSVKTAGCRNIICTPTIRERARAHSEGAHGCAIVGSCC